MTAVLRHAGTGNTRHCTTCDTWSNAGPGWKRAGPLKLWRCPACVQEKANAAG